MSEFVNRIRFLAAGQDDPQSIALSECAARIEALETALRDVIAYADRRGDGWLDSLARFALDEDEDDEP